MESKQIIVFLYTPVGLFFLALKKNVLGNYIFHLFLPVSIMRHKTPNHRPPIIKSDQKVYGR